MPAEDGRLIAVKSALVREQLVGGLARYVIEHIDDEVAPDLAEAGDRGVAQLAREVLQLASRDQSPLRRMWRAGYWSRLAEFEHFEVARQPVTWLAPALEPDAGGDAWTGRSERCVELALAEPLERPDAEDERAATWRVPGPGGHVRHYLFEELAAKLEGAEAGPELKRPWVYGFLLATVAAATAA